MRRVVHLDFILAAIVMMKSVAKLASIMYMHYVYFSQDSLILIPHFNE